MVQLDFSTAEVHSPENLSIRDPKQDREAGGDGRHPRPRWNFLLDDGRDLVEAELSQLQSLVVVAPVEVLEARIEERHAIDNPVPVHVRVDVKKGLAHIGEGTLALPVSYTHLRAH